MKPILFTVLFFSFSNPVIAAHPTLAIQAIEDRSASHLSGGCDLVGIWASPGEAVRELLADELAKIGGLDLVERDVLPEIFESEFGHKNLEKTPDKKKFLSASHALAGVISEFESCASKEDTRVDVGSLLGIGGLEMGSRSSSAHVAIELRLIEVKSGKIVKTFHSAGKIEEEGMLLSVDISGNRLDRDSFEKAPLGKATRQAVADAAGKIALALKK